MKSLYFVLFVFVSSLVYAFDFSADCVTGQTLYFNIIDSNEHRVSITYPGSSIDSAYVNYSMPFGDLIIPSVVSYNGQQYSVTKIESCSFAKCTGLNGIVVIPHTVSEIGNYAFLHCGNISVLYFNCEQCTSAFAAFEGCAFDSIILGNGVMVIPEGVFSNSSRITMIQIPTSVHSIGDRAFYNCPNLERVELNDSIISIGSFAFSDCPKLNTINSVNARDIDNYAFFGSRELNSVVLGNEVLSVGNYVFLGANSLDTVFCHAMSPPILGENSFSILSHVCKLLVGCRAFESYQTNVLWRSFFDILPDHSYRLNAIPIFPFYGYVTGSGDNYCYGDTVRVEAVPYGGFLFQSWSDGMTSNPRDIIMQANTIIIARFVADIPVGIEESNDCEVLNVSLIGRSLKINANYPTMIQIFDILGRCYYRSRCEEVSVTLNVPVKGVYYVVFGNGLLKKITVV